MMAKRSVPLTTTFLADTNEANEDEKNQHACKNSCDPQWNYNGSTKREYPIIVLIYH
jgi:hypothetical protein